MKGNGETEEKLKGTERHTKLKGEHGTDTETWRERREWRTGRRPSRPVDVCDREAPSVEETEASGEPDHRLYGDRDQGRQSLICESVDNAFERRG